MKTILRAHDLEAFGIIPLTGEADATMTRTLCDVTARGRRVFQEAFGLSDLAQALPPPWNSGTASDLHIGSIMLPAEGLLILAIFALGIDGADKIVVYKGGGVAGFYFPEDQEHWEEVERHVLAESVERIVNGWRKKPHGARNQHAMSGRVT